MIRKEEVFKIGIINKPHGVKGEVSFTFTDDIFDRVDCDYLILLLDGILVPFFIEEYRFRSDNAALVKFEGIDTAEKARSFTNVEVYFPKKYMEEHDATMNVLFVIEKEGEELLLPAHEEFILDIDKAQKVLTVDIPEGLLD